MNGSGSSTSRRLTRLEAFGDADDEEIDGRHDAALNGQTGRARTVGKLANDEALTGYSRSGAVRKYRSDDHPSYSKRKNAAPIIAAQSDANWMEERKRALGLQRNTSDFGSLTGLGGGPGVKSDRDAHLQRTVVDRIGDEPAKEGLEHRIKQHQDNRVTAISEIDETKQLPMSQEPNMPRGEDEAARAALMSGKSAGGAMSGKSNRIIHQQQPLSEEQVLRRDMQTRPDAPSISDYAAMPVEDFGAALLRGMGWKEGMGAGKQRQGPTAAPETRKRAALLGLGAKERAFPSSGAGGLTASSSTQRTASRHANAHQQRRYVPVIRSARDTKDDARKQSLSPPERRQRNYKSDNDRGEGRKRDRSTSGERYAYDRDRDRRSERDSDRKTSWSSRQYDDKRDEHRRYNDDDKDKRRHRHHEREHERNRDDERRKSETSRHHTSERSYSSKHRY